MKKLFTLLVGALFAGSAFAQKTWTNVVVNGDFEGTVPAYEQWGTEAGGISAVKTSKTGKGMIYNLAGQRVDASYKGLVIKNGKKAIQK